MIRAEFNYYFTYDCLCFVNVTTHNISSGFMHTKQHPSVLLIPVFKRKVKGTLKIFCVFIIIINQLVIILQTNLISYEY